MKRLGRRFLSLCLLTTCAVLGSACNSGAENGGGGGDTPGTGGQTSIYDAYENGGRPDYDGMFDYDSGYEATLPVDPNTKFTVTIGEGPVTFADGSKSKEVVVTTILKAEDFDFSRIPENRTFRGLALIGQDGAAAGTLDLENGFMVMQDIHVLPYYNAEEGYTSLQLGSGANSKYNTDLVPGDFTAHAKAGGYITLQENQLVKGGDEGYAELGLVVNDSGLLTAGSAIRFDTKYGETIAAGIYRFSYNFENKGTSALHISGYNISASSEYKAAGGYYAYESRYRMDIDLEPGESVRFTPQYNLGSNGNALTYLVLDKDVEGLSLGISIAYKKVEDATEPENPAQDPYGEKATITLELPAGFTVSDDWSREWIEGKRVTLPTADQITNNTDGSLQGWNVLNGDGSVKTAFADGDRMPQGGMTLAPDLLIRETATITFKLPSGIQVQGYDTTVNTGETFSLPTDAQITNSTGRTIAGWYVVGAAGEWNTRITADTRVTGNATIAPYFTAEDGYTRLWMLSGKNNGISGTMTEFVAENFTATASGSGWGSTLESAKIAVNGTDGIAEEGVLLQYNAAVKAGARVRLDTALGTAGTNGAPGPIAAGTHTFVFNFENRGTEAVTLKGWVINSGSDITSTENNEIAQFTLQPGEAVTVRVSPKYSGSNGNALPYLEVVNDLADGLKLGVSMSVKYNTDQPAVDPEVTANVTLDLPEGITVGSEYRTEIVVGDNFAVPTAAQVTNTTGKEIAGWYIKGENGSVTLIVSDTEMPEGGVTIAPYFGGVTVNGSDERPDWFGYIGEPSNPTDPDHLATYDNSKFSAQLTAENNELVKVFSFDGTLKAADGATKTANDYFRWKTPYSVAANKIYEIGFVLYNKGSQEIKIKLHQVRGARDITAAGTISSEELVIAPGASVTVTLQDFTVLAANTNLLTIVEITADVTDMKLGARMTVTEKEPPKQTAILTVQLPAGLTVEGYQTEVYTGDALIVPSADQIKGEIADGREIIGWYIVGKGGSQNTVITADTKVTGNATIAPYFSRVAASAKLQNFGDSTDGKDLVFCNVQANLKPTNVNGSITTDNFTAIASKYTNDTVIAGGTGYSELGNMLRYTGEMTVDSAFRAPTAVGKAQTTAVVKTGVEHTFIYTFQNFGDGAIHLKMQAVNSGTDVEGPVQTIDLEPGESVQLTFRVTFTKGSTNLNIMAYFTVTQTMTNMALGAAVSVILGA